LLRNSGNEYVGKNSDWTGLTGLLLYLTHKKG
jgi:hypothetical protein